MGAKMMVQNHSKSGINCTDKYIEEALQILEGANGINLFLPDTSRQSIEAVSLIREASSWVNIVKSRIDSYSLGDAIRITEVYDLMHRIAFNRPAERKFINNIIMRAFRAMICGDKDVDEYIMFKLIRRAAREREKEFLDIPLTWSCHALNDWYNQAVKGFDSAKLSDYDILNRVNILLESDLYAYEGCNQGQFKKRLFENHRQYFGDYERI